MKSIKHAYSGILFFRPNPCSRRLTGIKEERLIGKLLRQDPHMVVVLTKVTSDNFQQYPAEVYYQRYTSVVITLFYLSCGIPRWRHSPTFAQFISHSTCQRRRQVVLPSPLRSVLHSSKQNSIQPNSLPVSQRPDGTFQLLHRGLDSQLRVYRALFGTIGNASVEEGVEPPTAEQVTVLVFDDL